MAGIAALVVSLFLLLIYVVQTGGESSLASAVAPRPTRTPGQRPATDQTHTSGIAGSLGTLKVENGTGLDGFVRLSRSATTPVVAAGSVRSHGTLTLEGIPDGTYGLWFCTGSDWLPATHDFAVDYRCQRFEDSFRYSTVATPRDLRYTTWEVTLHKVVSGDAETRSVEPDNLPPLN